MPTLSNIGNTERNPMTDHQAGITLFASIGFIAFLALVGILHRWDAILINLGI